MNYFRPVKSAIRPTSWEGARGRVKELNPKLCHLIDKLSPSKKYPLFIATYPFGAEPVQEGRLYLPDNNGQLVRYDDNRLDKSLQTLSYNLGSNPVSLILNNSFEIYLEMDNHTMPSACLSKGTLFSTWLVLNPQKSQQPPFLWHVSAGARSLFMLSKISIDRKHDQLKKYFNLEIHKPKNFFDHGEVFRALYNCKDFKKDWHTEVLYFGKEWFENLQDSAWVKFFRYLYESTWKGTEFWRNEFLWNLIFSVIQRKKNLKPNPYVADTVKHLFAMSIGAYPGFAPAADDSLAPISRLRQIYSDIYRLENEPIIMQPTYFDMNQASRPIYYSLAYPTTLVFSPKSKRTANKISELKEIHDLIERYLKEIKTDEFNIHDTPLANMPKLVRFDCFHTSQISNKIRDGSLIFDEDQTFTPKLTSKQFPKKSPFLRGCVRIASALKNACLFGTA